MTNDTNGPQPADLTSLPLFQKPAQAAPPEPAEAAAPAPATPAAHLLRATSRPRQEATLADETTDESTPIITEAPTQPAAPLPSIATATARVRRSGPRKAEAAFEEQGKIPWDLVAQFRDKVSKILSDLGQDDPTLTDDDREMLAREHTAEMLRIHVDDLTTRGDPNVPSDDLQEDIIEAVFNAMFRLGRLQPLVEIEGVENIDIIGYDNVWLTIEGGARQRFPHPISTSNDDLEKEINFIATRRGEGGRSFNASRPTLHLDLAGGARLAANAVPILQATGITIRVHRHISVTLDDMVESRTVPRAAANLLAALVRSGSSIVTNGFQSSGKTTLLRALADEIPPHEKIATIEMERELHIHVHKDKHPIVLAFEYRPGEGEPGPDGVRAGEYTLIQAVNDSLRHTTDRIIVGEVRGPEINAMLQAMQAGIGSMSTLHSYDPEAAIERMVTLMMRDGANVTPAYAYRQIAQNIDVIVQMAKIKDHESGRTRRVVTAICEVKEGEDDFGVRRPVLSPIFEWDKDSQVLVKRYHPSSKLLAKLVDAGYDASELASHGGEAS